MLGSVRIVSSGSLQSTRCWCSLLHRRSIQSTARTTWNSRRRMLQSPCVHLVIQSHFSADTKSAARSIDGVLSKKPMDDRLLYRYLKLETFAKCEIHNVFDEIVIKPSLPPRIPSLQDDFEREEIQPPLQNLNKANDDAVMDHVHVRDFLLKRIEELEKEHSTTTIHEKNYNDLENTLRQAKLEFAQEEATRLLNVFSSFSDSPLNKKTFTKCIVSRSSEVNVKRVMPIAISILLVGFSVGITTPIMPFVVENLGLTPGQYGHVVSAFALAKMLGNIPSAILVERHGRKPYLVYSLLVVAMGAGGIGLANQFEHLYLCRLLTGFGVAALSTAATITMSDISTPRNRASTMAPVMSAFAAGTALGPALGGILADSIGISSTFYLVGVSYIGCSVLNHLLLSETQTKPITFSWQQKSRGVVTTKASKNAPTSKSKEKKHGGGDLSVAVKDAVGQWAPLMSDARVRNVVIMNGFYWFALAGAQMTLLPLMLTDPSGLAMTATGVGKVYMGMSLVQVLGNPSLAKMVDKLGKGPAIVGGCTLLSVTMAVLPFCSDTSQMAATLGLWALGSTVLSTAPVAYVSDSVSDAKRAQAIALLRTAGDVGFLVGATGTGALADWTGNLDVAMQSSSGLLLTATGWFALRRYLRHQLAAASEKKQ